MGSMTSKGEQRRGRRTMGARTESGERESGEEVSESDENENDDDGKRRGKKRGENGAEGLEGESLKSTRRRRPATARDDGGSGEDGEKHDEEGRTMMASSGGADDEDGEGAKWEDGWWVGWRGRERGRRGWKATVRRGESDEDGGERRGWAVDRKGLRRLEGVSSTASSDSEDNGDGGKGSGEDDGSGEEEVEGERMEVRMEVRTEVRMEREWAADARRCEDAGMSRRGSFVLGELQRKRSCLLNAAGLALFALHQTRVALAHAASHDRVEQRMSDATAWNGVAEAK
ncbi:hypothetical protein DFH06DRAFT_1310447 [Mycena polygramma]|nr:hypothetical protein DFH06DRAFT_1310447 [Mycena polygramma]